MTEERYGDDFVYDLYLLLSSSSRELESEADEQGNFPTPFKSRRSCAVHLMLCPNRSPISVTLALAV